MLRLKYILIVMAVLMITLPVQAEFYKYRDENGVLRFTDDLSRVPPDQRADVEASKGVKSVERSATDRRGIEPGYEEIKPDRQPETEESKKLSDLKKMNAKKEQMDQEYSQLVLEKEELVKMKKEIKGHSELTAYNEKIVDLNDRISQYEIRRQVFSKEVEAFNEKTK